MPHPFLGMMTGREWLRFIYVHNKHHLKIIREIIDATDSTLQIPVNPEIALEKQKIISM